ncbi:MAG TPA: HD domain-containing protein [Candidatus Absconditabacterales bacterium]|nr:HD domain-containing protein [Candidatus Absconditabacterales bacterium]
MLNKIKSKIKKIFEKNGSHDLDHTMRVHYLCKHIGQKEGANIEILEIASLLHDIGRPKQSETKGKICHAEYGAKLAKEILDEFGLGEDKINEIVHCIQTHRFRKNNEPKSLEAKVLFDADKIDSIGAVGIGRAFMYANEVGAKLHNDKHVDLLKTEEYSIDDTAYREYIVKLSKIKDRMFTKTGKKLAEQRHHRMNKFFENIIEETRGLENL